jgi:glycolate oxidase
MRTYECDGLTGHRAIPQAVVLPSTTAQVQAAVGVCRDHGIPFVARGAGTGLSGGAVPVAEGIVIGLARMNAILEVDLGNRRVRVQPGVANLDVTRAVAPHGLYYAPDPSSQQVCTIGGNVAENSGGAHCLKYGFTTNHVLALEVVLASGEAVRIDRHGGLDLLGAFVGSEGTLGIATEITVAVLPRPQRVETILAAFESTDAAGEVVSAVIAGGIVPAAIEMMDSLTIRAAEAAVGAGLPLDAGAVLLVELDGPAAEVEVTTAQVRECCAAGHASEVRVAATEAERAAFWRGRKAAFAAMGRVSPDYYVQDGVVPRTRLPETLRRIGELSRSHGLEVGNVFHAGDGNLHPLVLYDGSVEGQAERAEELAAAILEACVDAGGSLTGEHGIGVDKACHMPLMYSADDMATMLRLRSALDPAGLTVGVAFAQAVSGPRSHRYGHPRDLVLGMRVRLADGTEARVGGKVVKTVAGYDLPKLFTGARGRLGEILELTLRLHPLPAGTCTVVTDPSDPRALEPLAPACIEYAWPPEKMLVRFESPVARALADEARDLVGGDLVEADEQLWADHRERAAGLEPVHCLPAEVPAAIAGLRAAGATAIVGRYARGELHADVKDRGQAPSFHVTELEQRIVEAYRG